MSHFSFRTFTAAIACSSVNKLLSMIFLTAVFSSPYVSSKTRATDPPQRVQMPLSTSIRCSIFPLTLPMAVISEQLTHHTLFNIFIRISPGMAFQIFRAWGVNENSTEVAVFLILW
jgi:hypothetical protein